MSLSLTIEVVDIGGGQRMKLGDAVLSTSRVIAVTRLAGITLRGPAADDPVAAVRALFWEMTNGSGSQTSRDAEVAIGLALDDRDVSSMFDTPALLGADDVPQRGRVSLDVDDDEPGGDDD